MVKNIYSKATMNISFPACKIYWYLIEIKNELKLNKY